MKGMEKTLGVVNADRKEAFERAQREKKAAEEAAAKAMAENQ